MNCLVCGKALDELTPLCADHAPACGKTLYVGGLEIFVGDISFIAVLIAKFFLRTKVVRWWIGTDVWLLHKFPQGRGKFSVMKHRIKYHLTKGLVSENWLVSENFKKEFEGVGGKRSLVRRWHHAMLIEKIEKTAHEGINIAYYWPASSGEYGEYVYGIDLVKKLEILFPAVHWIRLDGSLAGPIEMRMFLPILDAYIRPSRHDGWPRLVYECRNNGIPVYWREDGNPNLDELCEFVKTATNGKR